MQDALIHQDFQVLAMDEERFAAAQVDRAAAVSGDDLLSSRAACDNVFRNLNADFREIVRTLAKHPEKIFGAGESLRFKLWHGHHAVLHASGFDYRFSTFG